MPKLPKPEDESRSWGSRDKDLMVDLLARFGLARVTQHAEDGVSDLVENRR
jgi:hypothetical protein